MSDKAKKQKRTALYIVEVPASGSQSYLVYATSKAEAVRKCRMGSPDADPQQGDLNALHWSRAKVAIDEKH
jgi:hypothetical protein